MSDDLFNTNTQSNSKVTKGDFKPKTPSGYDLRMVRSALQKSIRYGLEEKAIFWAQEMVLGGYVNYLVKTLAVILSEDIGWASPPLYSAVQSNLVFLKAMLDKKEKFEFGPSVSAAVLMMCRARKTRAADNAWQFILEKKKAGFRLPIPDYARDEHNSEGRALGRSWKFWVRIGSVLKNKANESEIGGSDYGQMNEYWLKGNPDCPDEPDYEPLDLDDPEKPVVAKVPRVEDDRQ